jgi:hypothetical protein
MISFFKVVVASEIISITNGSTLTTTIMITAINGQADVRIASEIH